MGDKVSREDSAAALEFYRPIEARRERMDSKGNGKALMAMPVVTGPEMDLMTLGNVFAKSGFFQDSREAAQAITKIIAGRELGIGAIAAMTGIYIVKGRVTLGANLIAALIKRSGRYDYRVRKLDNDGCTIAFFEAGQEVGEFAFTMQDAANAGLGSGDNWKHFPRNMCFARAISSGARVYCPDLLGGPLYTPGELGSAMDPESGGPLVDLTTGEVIEAETVSPAAVSSAPAPTGKASNGKGRQAAIAKIAVLEDELRALNVQVADVDTDRLANDAVIERGKALAQLKLELETAGWPAICERAVAAGAEVILEDIDGRKLLEFVNNWHGIVGKASEPEVPELEDSDLPF